MRKMYLPTTVRNNRCLLSSQHTTLTQRYHKPEIDNNDNGEDPIITQHDKVLEGRDRIENDLKDKQSSRITLDIGGRHFATSRSPLLKEKYSLFAILLQEEKTYYFIDRDGAHFRYILNYLREECSLSIAILPRENRYLLELRNECIFYKLKGLQCLVETRLQPRFSCQTCIV